MIDVDRVLLSAPRVVANLRGEMVVVTEPCPTCGAPDTATMLRDEHEGFDDLDDEERFAVLLLCQCRRCEAGVCEAERKPTFELGLEGRADWEAERKFGGR